MIQAGAAARPERRWLLTSDGVRLRAQVAPGPPGTGTVLVVVHGFSGSTTKPVNRAVLRHFAERFGVIGVDLRGHGESGGASTLGDLEVNDVSSAVDWARLLGFDRVFTLGFSMGAAVCVRHAGLAGGVDGVVAVSGPAFWDYRGTPVMRRLHFGVEHPIGRLFVRHGMRTTVIRPPFPSPWPTSPAEVARQIPPAPFLIVHGRQDEFFPEEHAHALQLAAEDGARERGVRDRSVIWLRDFGHAEAAVTPQLLDDIGDWIVTVGG